ncbi:MAG: DUF5063 domain-containing protein [Actinomycetes bacterium]
MSEPTGRRPEAAGSDEPGETAESNDEGLRAIAETTAVEAKGYLDAVAEVASGTGSDTAIPVLLLAVSQVLASGARLGAITDVVPSERYEPDAGPDPDIDPVRTGLANVLEGLDEYVDVVDPLTSGEMVRGSLSNDLSDVAAALVHGLRHFEVGRVDEALWWWQFSYLSSWGERAASALRVLQSVLSHLRLDADDETVADAEFEALHP